MSPSSAPIFRSNAHEAAGASLILLVLVGVLVIAGGAAYYFTRSNSSPQAQNADATTESVVDANTAQSSTETLNDPAASRTPAPRLTSVTETDPPTSPLLLPQDLLNRLTQFDSARGALTPERAAQLKQDLKDLVAQGTNALPAIRQFLDRNQDISLDDPNGPALVGSTSLRAALLGAVHEIGGPEATETFLQTLTSTAEPREIALVAKYLDEQSPGQYRENVIAAARESVNQFAKGQIQTTEIGPLFQVMQTYGDASVVPDLRAALSQWPTYAVMALAGLPEGEGVAALLEQLQDPASQSLDPAQRSFGYQMLAQNSAQSPAAANALLEQARQGQVPDSAWVKIAEGLAGPQYQMTMPVFADSSPKTLAMIAGMTTYRLEHGNQNYYSLAYDPAAAPGETAQRRAIIDQLLAVARNNAAAVNALQRARQTLARF